MPFIPIPTRIPDAPPPTLPERYRRVVEKANATAEHWENLRGRIGAMRAIGAPHARALERDLRAFLDASLALTRTERVGEHLLPYLMLQTRRHLALLVVLAVIAAISFRAAILRNLLLDEQAALAGLVVVLLLPLPVLHARAAAVRRRTPGSGPLWDLGGPGFRSLGYAAVPPDTAIRRWSRSSQFRRCVYTGLFAKCAVYAAWFGTVWLGAYLVLAGDPAQTVLTLVTLLSLFGLMLVAASSLDFINFVERVPVRMGVLWAAGLVTLALAFKGGHEMVAALSIAAGAGLFAVWWERRDRTGSLYASCVCLLVLLGTWMSSSTLERAVWAEPRGNERRLVRLAPDAWPYRSDSAQQPPVVLVAASGGGSRAAVYTALALERLNADFPDIARNIQAISSVSGGSLANAVYVSRLLGAEAGCPDRQCVRGLEGAVSGDFILPTLIGALLPRQSRSDALERRWKEQPVGLSDHALSHLVSGWTESRRRGDGHPPFPIPLFNATTLDGHNVVISPLPRSLYVPYELAPDSNHYDRIPGRPTWVYYRDGIYGLEDLLRHYDPHLSEAVRASASFPFGFPMVEVETTQPLAYSPDARDRRPGRKEVRLTDGGALSNSGMWPLFNLMMNKAPELRQRGVLLIVIDASKMPSLRGVQSQLTALTGTLLDKSPVGQNWHRQMFQRLQTAYGTRLAIVQLDLLPQREYNVLTTWALDRNSMERLRASFESRWTAEVQQIEDGWRAIKVPPRDSLPVAVPIRIARPPLS